MNNIKHPIVFKSAPGAYTHTLIAAESIAKKFRSSNLDFALHTAIEDGRLFVMPEGKRFAYCRGTGPVGFHKVRVSYHEGQTKEGNIDFNSPRSLLATYSIVLVDDTGEDERISIDLQIPSRFTNLYIVRSEGIPHNSSLTRIEFVYTVKELKAWIKEAQKELYERAEKSCIEDIIKINHRIKELKRMAAGGRPQSQSAFE